MEDARQDAEKNDASREPSNHQCTPADVLPSRQRDQKLEIGVTFRKLHSYGFISSARYQPTFASYALALPKLLLEQLTQRHGQKVCILNGLEGLISPGEMLLVLGRPGSGCSTFLKTLAGDTHGFHIGADTEINYQGIPYQQMRQEFKGERVYLAELDVHFPDLTLGQTLNFAASTREKSPDPEAGRNVASLFSLNEAFDTQVGDAKIRGISGGEKRRTSIAETFIGGAQLQLWDNSTRGLDSSTARRFIRLLRESTNTTRSTVAMSLYQASEGMYKDFDKVMVLYEGRQIYFGPVESAADYFIALGFVRPSRATTPDFLTSVTNPTERIVREGFEHRVPRLPDEFANLWKLSNEARALRAEIDHFNTTLRTSTYPLSTYLQTSVCLRRALQRFRNNNAPVISAVVANSILGLIVGSVFYDLSDTTDSLQERAILLFFALMLNAFAPAFEVSLMWAQRPIVEKHDRYAFYHPWTERLASVLCDLPTKIGMCFMLHIPIYFMSNLRRTAAGFFVYLLFMLVNMITMSMLFRMLGSVSRTREQTVAPFAILSLLFVLYAGFVVPIAYQVPWLGWFRYINPVAFTYESLMINEFDNRSFLCSTLLPDGPAYSGVEVRWKTCSTVGSDFNQQEVQGTKYLFFKYGYIQTHQWRNLGILLAMMAGFCVLHLLAAEYIPAQRSRGEILLFKRTWFQRKSIHSKGLRKDDEAAQSEMFAQEAHAVENKNPGDGGRGSNSTHKDGNQTTTASHQAVCHWIGLNYEIKTPSGPRAILRNIDGWVKPGTLTALMGVTGAGKTSLLDVLADRVTVGTISGDIFVDRRPRDYIRRRMGYVQQDDIHLPTTTVREALEFSALLRQPKTRSRAQRLGYVDSVLKMLDMEHYSEAVVGVQGEGLNVEQRRRLTIAVEVVAMPDLLLFLDEPTSGLDSQTAWSICTLLRKLADSGQTLLCTIHQPSAQLFGMFDRLLLLDKTGTTLYFGDIGRDATTLITYFESHGASKCPPEENPAEWMLDVTGNLPDSRGDDRKNWPEIWHLSEQRQHVLEELFDLGPASLSQEVTSSARDDGKKDEYAASLGQQMMIVTKRLFSEHWRDPVYLYSKLGLCVGLNLTDSLSFYDASSDIQGLINLLFCIFLTTQIVSTLNRLVIPRFVEGRDVFESRERKSRTYSWVVFIAANIVVEMAWQTLLAVPFFVSWYYPTGLQRSGDGDATFGTAERGGLTFVLIWLFCLWVTSLSQVFAAAIGHFETAIQLATLCFWLTLVFCGILASPSQMPGFWIFMYRVSPLTYFLDGLAIAGVANRPVVCSALETLQIDIPPAGWNVTLPVSCTEYLAPYIQTAGGYVTNPTLDGSCMYCPVSNANAVLSSLDIDADKQIAWRNAGFLVAYLVFNVVATFALYWLVRVPRRKAGVH